MTSLRIISAFLYKDLVREARGGETFLALATFGLILILTLSFALPRSGAEDPGRSSGALWAALLFASQIGIARSVEVDRHGGRWEMIRTAPVDATILFLAKSLSLGLFLALAALVLLIPYAVLFDVALDAVARLIPVLLLGILAITLTGTFLSFLASASRVREIVTPLLHLTILVPVLLAAMAASVAAMENQPAPTGRGVLVGFILVLGGAAVLMAPSLMEE